MTGDKWSWAEELRGNRARILPYGFLVGFLLVISIFLGYRNALPTWGDESFTLRLASESWSEFRDEIVNDVHPPLYFALCKLVGPDLVRILSYIIFLFLLWEISRLVKRRVSKPYPIILPALLIVSSAHLALFGPMMRYYALSALGVTCATLYLLPPLHLPPNYPSKPLTHRSVWYGIFLWIALASSYLTVVVIPAHVIHLLTRPKSESRHFWKSLFWVLIFSIPLLWLMVVQLKGVSGVPWPGVNAFIIAAIARFCFTIYSFLIGEFIRPWDWWLSIPAFLAFFYLVTLAWRVRSTSLGSLLWLTLSISLPLGVLLLSKIGVGLEFSASRLFFLAPMFLLLLAKGPSVDGNSKLMSRLGTIAIVVLVAVNLVSTFNYSRGTNFIQSTYIIPWEEISKDVVALDTDETFILHDDETLMYWLPENLRNKGNTLHFEYLEYLRDEGEEITTRDRLIVIYSPRCFTDSELYRAVEYYARRALIPVDEIEYLHEDETSVLWKSMLLRRQVNEVKKKLVVYEAAG